MREHERTHQVRVATDEDLGDHAAIGAPDHIDLLDAVTPQERGNPVDQGIHRLDGRIGRRDHAPVGGKARDRPIGDIGNRKRTRKQQHGRLPLPAGQVGPVYAVEGNVVGGEVPAEGLELLEAIRRHLVI